LKIPRFRGVLAVEVARIRTGDGGFRAQDTPQPVFFSAAKLGGSGSHNRFLDAARTSVDVNIAGCGFIRRAGPARAGRC
jgi:hypothetical protein